MELMEWPKLEAEFKETFNKLEVFSKTGSKVWADLRTRVIEHNVRVIEKYYKRIRIARMSKLLHLSAEETETFVSRLVVEKAIWARIDRPSGVIIFRKVKRANDILNDWSRDITKLLDLMEKSSHLINREFMVHKINA
eukprot:TRINITY_DN7724_c0_g1_i1.p1 TRINITY_DN7724_c0_g1~~TRINITY_DN7724_c0_g1_i1.p1  ORF type:complete len:138 (-),score=12.09 TRINITY_DN7724_c0_g1_i1:50-463(-)